MKYVLREKDRTRPGGFYQAGLAVDDINQADVFTVVGEAPDTSRTVRFRGENAAWKIVPVRIVPVVPAGDEAQDGPQTP